MADPDPKARLDHLVVLMFENRSFDQLLGYLYRAGEQPSFEGVDGRDLGNPIPADAKGAERRRVPVHPATSLDVPDPDPGEEHPHVNTQLFNVVDPPENRDRPMHEIVPPFNAPSDPAARPT